MTVLENNKYVYPFSEIRQYKKVQKEKAVNPFETPCSEISGVDTCRSPPDLSLCPSRAEGRRPAGSSGAA